MGFEFLSHSGEARLTPISLQPSPPPEGFFQVRRTRFAALLLAVTTAATSAGQDFIPRKQTAPPGPPKSPAEAIAAMQVPEGFQVELVASEPSIQNPVAMAFDDRGRIYVTESFEYPRREPGPGRDRIKILEDKDGDGFAETVKIFAEGLNIPSGIAVGHGGVWVANAPDILFLEDTNGDDVADKQTVVVTGFGRDDTHELPNALTWGPDGALYGLNGVFNPSRVSQGGKTFEFTCALFRIDPKTRQFDLFCEGTSNPWGIAFDTEGSAFVSACVIDHLWHLTESAYYLRQGGPYPPHTFYAESIVKHKHQMAAYCGIEFLDTDAYPSSFNNKLYMGNIHGGCLNSDSIERFGATYRGKGEPDFLTANDVWFMPVAQKVGPDGCLYVLDWYDRYHCYQDANADPKGVDRGHGRLYRVVHEKRPKRRVEDFEKLTDAQLVALLADPNIFNRQRAQLKLQERNVAPESETARMIQKVVFDKSLALKTRLHALWSLVGSTRLTESMAKELLHASEPELRAWGVRTVGRQVIDTPAVRGWLENLASDSDPRVRVEVSIASPKLARAKQESAWNIQQQMKVLSHSGPDPILSRVVWQNMLPDLVREQDSVLSSMKQEGVRGEWNSLVPRFATLLLSQVNNRLEDERSQASVNNVLSAASLIAKEDSESGTRVLNALLDRVRSGEISIAAIQPLFKRWIANSDGNGMKKAPDDKAWKTWTGWEQAIFQVHLVLGDAQRMKLAKELVVHRDVRPEWKKQLVQVSSMLDDSILLAATEQLISELEEQREVDGGLRDTVLDLGLRPLSTEQVAGLVARLPKMKGAIQSAIAERLCQRSESAEVFLKGVKEGLIRKELLSPNRIRLLAASNQPNIRTLVGQIWGSVNTESSKEREAVIQRVGNALRWDARGNAEKGWLVYDRICGQCHVMHGRGNEVGPNITSNGRGSYEQLLVSVFNPSLVIGEAYKSVTIRTKDDEIITGLLVERTDKRVVVKVQGGKEQTIAAEEIDEFKQDSKSLMPEGLENQMTPQELADLFALLTLEQKPDSKENSKIQGTPDNLHSKTR